jgi:hypothetical protein
MEPRASLTGPRLIRGFKRLGIALAIPCFLGAAGLLSFGIYQEYQREHDPWKEFPGVQTSAPAKWGAIRLEPVDYDPFSGESKLTEVSLWSASICGLGLTAFLGMWLVGWVFAGFAKD